MNTVQYMSTNRECSDQTARIRMLIRAFAVRIWHKGIFQRFALIMNSFNEAEAPLFVFYVFGVSKGKQYRLNYLKY